MKGLFKSPAQIWYQGGMGVGVATLTGNRTLSGTSAHAQYLTASGADRSALLPALGPNGAGQWFIVRNAGASNNILVKTSDGGTTIVTLAPGDWAYVISGKVSGVLSWYVAQTTVGLVALTLTGALSAVAATFTGRVTTTDGVASGDARIVGGVVHAKQTTTTVTNTTTETAIGSHSIPANTIKAGTTVRVRGSFKCTGNAGGHTATLRVKLGAVELLNTSALNTVANDVCEFEAIVSGRATPGASVALASLARASYQQGGTLSSAAAVKDAATYTGQATNGALTAQATIQWSAASASDIITCDQFTVEVIG